MSSMPICQQVFVRMWQMCLYSCVCVHASPAWSIPRRLQAVGLWCAWESLLRCLQSWREATREVDRRNRVEMKERATSSFSLLFATVRCNQACDRSVCEYRTLDLKGSGNPPCGIPMYPCRNSTTDRGKDNSSALSSTSALVRLFCTMNWAKSPTILEDGVTWEGERQQCEYQTYVTVCVKLLLLFEKRWTGGWGEELISA